jgi:MHS family proline/betaine transporter-like MFS transporter
MIFVVPFAYYLLSIQFNIIGVVLLSMLQGCAAMLTPYIITNLFPTNIRLTGVSLSYNIAFSVLGGLPPLFITYFINLHYNLYLVPIVYLELTILFAIISVVALYKYSPKFNI